VKATGRTHCIYAKALESMPRGDGMEKDIYFFKLNCFADDIVLDQEYKLRGLKPVDPYSLAQVNIDDHAFADRYPNCTHWQDSNNNWCFITFSLQFDGRSVAIDVNYEDDWVNEWSDQWWAAGYVSKI